MSPEHEINLKENAAFLIQCQTAIPPHNKTGDDLLNYHREVLSAFSSWSGLNKRKMRGIIEESEGVNSVRGHLDPIPELQQSLILATRPKIVVRLSHLLKRSRQ